MDVLWNAMLQPWWWGSMTVSAGVVAVTVGIALGVVQWWMYHPLRNVLPGPRPTSFLLGNAIASWHTTTAYPEPYLSWLVQYGPAVYYRELFSHTVMLSDPKALQHVLVTHASKYPRHPIIRAYLSDIVLGKGLVSSEGARHDAHRKLLNPHFTAAQVKSFVPVFEQLTSRCCTSVLEPAAASNKRLNMAVVLQELTLGIIGRVAFGFDFYAHPEALAAYQKLQMSPSPLVLIGMFSVPGFMHLPLPSLRQRRAAKAILANVIADVMKHKLSSSACSKTDQTTTPGSRDLLDLILADSATSHSDAMTHTMTFMTAGHETTSTALAWLMVECARRPHVVAKIRSEVRTLLDAPSPHTTNPLATWEGVHSLKYTTAVINETMRFHPVFFQLMRRLVDADDDVPMLDGSSLFLPKGTSINILTSAIHLNPQTWANPTEFVPERFLEGSPEWNADAARRGGKSHSFVYMPFSMGSKNCIGQRFAMAEMVVVVATFLRHFDFALTDHANTRDRYNAMTVVPAFLEMSVTRVSAAAAHR
ncbi:hypothetical protein DYB32_008012 [Aphanomyces invadans]|uniref:Cytochrome P450 n=1 Tax=Aphanomyces invadans TaxID=157072 RepID=A0A3R6WHF1_9STRA|nr:hypothetical protein DYB32_008012 [Aphanomyces invadans]